MKFNLRGLLAYLDDRLTPESASLVGDYISEHDRVKQLTDRIKRVLRRRRLSTPDVAERQELPPHHQDDPNEVAAYLDGKMTEEQEADFEQICIDTDVYLAEVAACHQVMTFGHDTLKVPPLARQRMYALVTGPESQPLKVVPREPRQSKPPLWEVDGVPSADPEDQALLEPLYHSLLGSRWRKALLGLCALLVVSLVAYLAWSLPWRQWTNSIAEQSEKNDPALVNKIVGEPVKEPTKEKPVVPVKAAPNIKVDVWPVPIVTIEGVPGWQTAADTFAHISAMIAGRPTLPFNVFLGLGEEKKPNEPIVPLPVLANSKPRVAAPDRTTKVAVASNGADALGMFVQGNDAGDLTITKPAAPLIANQRLMALPGYTGNIALPDGLRMILMGQFNPALNGGSTAETVVELHPSMEVDADFTLHRGRLLLQGRPVGKPSANIRLRYFGETWELTLPAGSEVGIQARGEILSGEGEWKVDQFLEILVSKGQVDVRHEEQSAQLNVKQKIEWQSSKAGNKSPVSEVGEVPVWLAKYQTAPKEAVESLVALRARAHAKLEKDGSDLKWLALAGEEGLEQGKLIDRHCAIQTLVALQRLKPVLQLQNDPLANGRRKFSHEAIHHWLKQDVSRAGMLVAMLKEGGYTDDDAKLLLALYRGTTQKTPEKLQGLLRALGSSQVAIREEAWRVLSTLAPERPNIFDPVGPEDQRIKAVSILTSKLLQKPAGEVPPPP
jgi:hypothetical protein